jgi:hypothetical protein
MPNNQTNFDAIDLIILALWCLLMIVGAMVEYRKQMGRSGITDAHHEADRRSTSAPTDETVSPARRDPSQGASAC